MRTPLDTIREFMAAFISAWPTGDAGGLGDFFTDDAVYHNIPLVPVQGRDRIEATLAEFMAMGGQVDVEVPHVVAEGSIVMTERVDHFIRPEGTLSLPVMGTFEVHDGKISAWRDYFDLGQFTSAGPV